MVPEMHFAPGVDLRGMSVQVLFAYQAASVACFLEGVRCSASCVRRPGVFATDGFHAPDPRGDVNAIDIGMRGVALDVGDRIWARLNNWIGRPGGGQFDVVNELRPGTSKGWTGPHLHIEFQP